MKTIALLLIAATSLLFSGCYTTQTSAPPPTPEQVQARAAARARWGEAGLSVLRFGLNVAANSLNNGQPLPQDPGFRK